MTFSEILSLIQLAAIIGVGFYLNQRIKTQDKIIESYQKVFDSTDIKRLSEYYKEVASLTQQHAVTSTKIAVQTGMQEWYAKWGNQYDEMASFINGMYESMPKEQADNMIRHMPSCKDLFPFDKLNKASDDARNESDQQDL